MKDSHQRGETTGHMPLFLDYYSRMKLRQNLPILKPHTFLHTDNLRKGKDGCHFTDVGLRRNFS